MSVAVRRPMTVEELLAWEGGQELRREFDAFVVCTPGSHPSTVVTDPVVVFEVLSQNTASIDHFVRNQEYRDTPSTWRCVILEQDLVGASVFAGAGDDWVGHVLGADATLDMPELGIELPLRGLHEGVEFGADGGT